MGSARGIRIQKDEGEEDDETAPSSFPQSAGARVSSIAVVAKMHSSSLPLSYSLFSPWYFPHLTPLAYLRELANAHIPVAAAAKQHRSTRGHPEQLLYARMDSISNLYAIC